MKFVKNGKKPDEPTYNVQDIAQAIGLSEGTISNYFTNGTKDRPKKSTKDGLTLDEIVMVIERPRTRGDGINWTIVSEIRRRLVNEKGFNIDWSDEEADNVEG